MLKFFMTKCSSQFEQAGKFPAQSWKISCSEPEYFLLASMDFSA
jgi:hypothetical protein